MLVHLLLLLLLLVKLPERMGMIAPAGTNAGISFRV